MKNSDKSRNKLYNRIFIFKLCLLSITFSFLQSKDNIKQKTKITNSSIIFSQHAKQNINSDLSRNKYKEIDPVVAVVIMVKNEQDVIEKTLEPYVTAGIDSILVFDTGSTDDTVKVTKRFFQKNHVKNGYILQDKFIDFSASRNQALDMAKKRFPNAGFFLMPDAEWYINNVEYLIDFCKKELDSPDTSKIHGHYHIKVLTKTMKFDTPRLIYSKGTSYFKGKIHEVVMSKSFGSVPNKCYFDYIVSTKGMNKSKIRWQRDKEILLQDYKEDPNNARALFYLAQTCACLGHLEEATKYYKLRTLEQSWPEEDHIAYYRLAKVLTDRIKNNDTTVNWHEAHDYYLKAYSMRPHRAEPLIALAQYYLDKGDYPLAFLYSERACKIKYPKDDLLFVEAYAYKFTRWDILSQSAWHVKEFKVGQKAIVKALKGDRSKPHVRNNLNTYLNIVQLEE